MMQQANGFLLLYSVTERSSLNAISKFNTEISKARNGWHAPSMIVGNKSDVTMFRQVIPAEGFNLANDLGFSEAMRESCSNTHEDVEAVVAEIASIIYRALNGAKMPLRPQ